MFFFHEVIDFIKKNMNGLVGDLFTRYFIKIDFSNFTENYKFKF